MHALARWPLVVRCALLIVGIATVGETVVLLAYAPSATVSRKGSATAVRVDDLDGVRQQIAMSRYSQGNSESGLAHRPVDPPNNGRGAPAGTPRGGPPEGGRGHAGGDGAGATVVQVPEPSSLVLLALGLFGASATIRRMQRR